MKKSIPIIQEWESEAFILGNGRELEFPLTPAMERSSSQLYADRMRLMDVIDGMDGYHRS